MDPTNSVSENQDIPPPDYSDSENEDTENDSGGKIESSSDSCAAEIHSEKQLMKDVEEPESKEDPVYIPEPDYDAVDSNAAEEDSDENLIANNKARQEINRELMLNQKMGIDVLHRKSELKKELDRRKTRDIAKVKKQQEKNNSFEAKLQEMANKINNNKDNNNVPEAASKEDGESQLEFQRIHSKIFKTKSGS